MAWLMPANMIINTASVVGYNNKLKQAVPGTKLGVNNTLNTDTKRSALPLMAGGPSKVNPPNSHPSNPIHEAVMAAQDPSRPKKRQSVYVLSCQQTRWRWIKTKKNPTSTK